MRTPIWIPLGVTSSLSSVKFRFVTPSYVTPDDLGMPIESLCLTDLAALRTATPGRI